MLYETKFAKLEIFKKGKVRDVYDLGEHLLIVATDRISCFDVVLPTPIPDKGKVLTRISVFWFDYFKDMINSHLVSADIDNLPADLEEFKEVLGRRFMLTKKCNVIPFECVVRGYLSGSGWKEYQKNQQVCGIELPSGLKNSSKLDSPIFTPATKAESGHDENVPFSYMEKQVGVELAGKIKDLSISIYKKAATFAEQKGIIIADTKFEFGLLDNRLLLVDEMLTPDSSRFWPKEDYQEGASQSSFDKQYVRDYLDSLDWPKKYPAPELPAEIVKKSREKYFKALELITGSSL